MQEQNSINWVEEMTSFQLARWAALVDGVNLVAEKADERNIKFDDINFRQLALQKYVDSTCDNICKQIIKERAQKEERGIHGRSIGQERLCRV